MNICIIDFETTGVDPLECIPLELGAIFINYQAEKGWLHSSRQDFRKLIHHPFLTDIPENITKLTGISFSDIKKEGEEPTGVLQAFSEFSKGAELFICHNVDFDPLVLANFWVTFPVAASFVDSPARKTENWICTVSDVPYPDEYTCKKLSHLAYDHGVLPREGEKAHSALTDCHLIRRMLGAGDYLLEKILAYKKEPWVYMKALIKPPWEDKTGTELAKKAGYSYEKARGTSAPVFPKTWVKRVKASKLQTEKTLEVPFKRVVLQTVAPNDSY